jgi:hypothetical protein
MTPFQQPDNFHFLRLRVLAVRLIAGKLAL